MKDMSSSMSWENGLNAGESMAGGNTTAYDADNHAMKGPGSKSVYPRPEMTDDPNLQLDPVKTPNTLQGAGHKTDGPWKSLGIKNGFDRAGD